MFLFKTKKLDIVLGHMDEKIDEIKDYIDPRIRDYMKSLYSILSVSIHELDEETSKDYYETLKAIIDMQLEYEFTEEEKNESIKEIFRSNNENKEKYSRK